MMSISLTPTSLQGPGGTSAEGGGGLVRRGAGAGQLTCSSGPEEGGDHGHVSPTVWAEGSGPAPRHSPVPGQGPVDDPDRGRPPPAPSWDRPRHARKPPRGGPRLPAATRHRRPAGPLDL